MLQTVNQDQHPDYPQKFKDAVRCLFPILCFTPDQTEAFIKEFEPQFDGENCMIEDEHGRPTFCRYSAEKNSTEIYIEYIIPSVWEDRYTMVKEAILQFKHEFLAANSECYLRMHINEKLPSHAAYYLGLLPELGFALAPRVTMIAPQDLVGQLTLPKLMPNIQEMPYQTDQLEMATYVDARAFGATEQELSAEMQADMGETDRRYTLEGTVQTWAGLACEGKLIGFAFGAASDDRMLLEEVSLLPEFHGKGLGRYLTIRCLQKLYESYGGPDKYFFLGTDRRWNPALKLYHRLGFTIDRIESYAMLTNTSPHA